MSRDALRLDSLKPRRNAGFWFYIFPARRAGFNLFGREQNCLAADPAPRRGAGEAKRLTNLVWRDILKLARTYFEQNS